MSFEMRPTSDLIQIARAGGGFILDAQLRNTSDLIQIAKAASETNARIVLRGMQMRSTADLIAIGRAGNGSIVFEA
jgi:hypothetical protein